MIPPAMYVCVCLCVCAAVKPCVNASIPNINQQQADYNQTKVQTKKNSINNCTTTRYKLIKGIYFGFRTISKWEIFAIHMHFVVAFIFAHSVISIAFFWYYNDCYYCLVRANPDSLLLLAFILFLFHCYYAMSVRVSMDGQKATHLLFEEFHLLRRGLFGGGERRHYKLSS